MVQYQQQEKCKYEQNSPNGKITTLTPQNMQQDAARRLHMLQQHLVPAATTVVPHVSIFHQETSNAVGSKYKQLVITKKSNDYRVAAQVQEQVLQKPTGKQLLVKNCYAGVNASGTLRKLYYNCCKIL